MLNYQYLLVIEALDSNGSPVTLRFCCGQKNTSYGGYTWTPGIIDPGLYQVNLFSGSKTYGASSYSYGEIVLNNLVKVGTEPGPKDALASYTYSGRPVEMYVGPETATFPSGFTVAYTATIQNATVNWDTVAFTIRGRQAELDKPLDTGKFLGNNTLPNGIEGVSTDLKDKTKPFLLGRAYNFAPVLCNTSKLIYAISPALGVSVAQYNSGFRIYDNGVSIYCEGMVNNIEQATPPEPGHCFVSQSGHVRLRKSPVGTVTCSAVTKDLSLTAHPSNLIHTLLDYSGHSDMIDQSNFDAYRSVDSHERGLYITSNANISSIIDQLLAPSGYWYFSRLGKMQLGMIKNPSSVTPGEIVYNFVVGVNVETFTRKKTDDTKGGVPASKVTLKYGKNYTKQDQMTRSTPERRAWVAEEWRTIEVDTNPNPDPFSEELLIETCMTHTPTGPTGLYTVARELIDIKVITFEFLDTMTLLPGQWVSFTSDRFEYVNKYMMIVGITVNYADESISLTLWG